MNKNTLRNKGMAGRKGGFLLSLLLLIGMLAVPVQAAALGESVTAADVQAVSTKQAKKITLKNTKGKNKKEVAAIKKILEKSSMTQEFLELWGYTNLNEGDFYSWSKSGRLTELFLFGAGISGKLSLKEFKELKLLQVPSNGLTSLDVSKNTKLKSLGCGGNKLTKLDVSKNTKLEYLYCEYNKLAKLDVSKNTKLKELTCTLNKLTNLNVSKNTKLVKLSCEDNKLTKLDVSKNTKLEELTCNGNKLTSLDVSKNTRLTSLVCYGMDLTSLDLSNNPELAALDCSATKLTSLDLSKNTKLEWLSADEGVDIPGWERVWNADMDRMDWRPVTAQ